MRLVLPQVMVALVVVVLTTLLPLVLETHLQHPHLKVTTVVRVQLGLLKAVAVAVVQVLLVLRVLVVMVAQAAQVRLIALQVLL
jgi:hypothetical protein